MKRFLQGKYSPKFPKKYKGNPCEIYYRSSWERKFMKYCDLNENVNQWQSEEFWIPYKSPLDGKVHRYFPDFFVKYKDKNGTTRTVVIEIKPKKEVEMPEQNPKRKTKSWAYQVQNWVKNQAKWKAAKEYCDDRNYEFRIMTEVDLGI